MNIGILLIEGDYEIKDKHEQFIYNETNNILYFGENVVLMKDKMDSKFFDVKNFLANENYEFRNLDKEFEANQIRSNLKNFNFSSLNDKNKIKNFENFLSYFIKEMRKIISKEFNVEAPKVEVRTRFKRKFTTVLNPEIGSLLSKIDEKSTKFISSKKMIEVNKNESFTGKVNFDNSYFDNSAINNCLPSSSLLKKQVTIFSKKNLPEIKIPSKLNEKEDLKNLNEDLKKESLIDTKKLVDISSYIEIEKNKIELLFAFYESFINIAIQDDYSNIFNGFDLINKNKKVIYNNTVLLTEFTNENKNTICKLLYQSPKNQIQKKKNNPKYSEKDYDFFDNMCKYKEINPERISKNDKLDLKGVIGCLGLNYNFLLVTNARDLIAILDILFLNMLGVLKSTLTDKILFFILSKSLVNKSDEDLIRKNIKKFLILSKAICLGLIYFLIEKAQKLSSINASEIYLKELEVRKIIRLSLNINNLESISTNFQINFKPENCFNKRKKSVLSFIKTLDKNFNISDELLIINQHLYDYIIFMKIQDLLVQEDQFAFRVYLEFRNFLFEYQDKNTTSTRKKIFKSLADKQLLQHSSRNLANIFYFWKPNIEVTLEKENNNVHLNKNSRTTRNPDRSHETNLFDNVALKAKAIKIELDSSENLKLILKDQNHSESRHHIFSDYYENNNNEFKNLNNNCNEIDNRNYYYENPNRISDHNKMKTLNLDNTNNSHFSDSKINKYSNFFNFKNNFFSNHMDLSRELKSIPEKETVKMHNSSNLPILNKHERNESSIMKFFHENKKQNVKKHIDNYNNNSFNFYKNQSLNNPLVHKSKANETSENYSFTKKSTSIQSNLDYNSSPSILKQNFREFSNNNNRFNSESFHALSKQLIKSKKIIKGFSNENANVYDDDDGYNNREECNYIKTSNFDLKTKTGKMSKTKTFIQPNFSKSSNNFFIDKKTEMNNKIIKFKINNNNKNNVDLEDMDHKHKSIKNNYVSSLSLESNYDAYNIPYNVFLRSLNQNNNLGNQIKKRNIIDINDQNDLKNNQMPSNYFMVRRNIILNRNTLKNPIKK